MAYEELLKSQLTRYLKFIYSLDERVIKFFYSPAKAFVRLKTRPSWIAPLLILMAVSISVVLLHHTVVPRKIRIEAKMEQLEGYGIRYSEEDRQAELVQPLTFYEYFSPVAFFVVSLLLAILISAATFWIAFTLSGHDFSFRSVLSIFNHAMLPPSITWSFLAGLVLLFKDPSEIDPLRVENVVLSNLAQFLDRGALNPFIYSLFSSIDLFSIWTIVLLSIGFSSCGKKLRIKKSVLVTTLVWGIYVFSKASVVSFFSL